ncbi:MAG: DUF1365 domain-containing protein [Bacteroidetes bacterium]|nr:DUF1365 domain-containing protein [Bacteroidota bacterium]
MQSCLYRATVMHNRLEPKKHRFHYGLFFFYLNLDTLDQELSRIPIISRNRFNLFGFYDRDHIQADEKKPLPLRESFNNWLLQQGVNELPAQVMLLTHLRVLGYVFNPVSFYYCFNETGAPLYVVAEVRNTFHEMKLYLLDCSNFNGKCFNKRQPKYFYVSPFIEHDAEFDFSLFVPSEKLNIRIDDYSKDRRIFISTLTGIQKPLSTLRLLGFGLRFPFITLQVITLIHWHALRLWFKKIRFFRKAEHADLQREVMRPYRKDH